MKKAMVFAAFSYILVPSVLAQTPQCTVPNTLTNGQVADATEVMDNFNAVAACVDQTTDEAVTHEGTPTAGEIAVFDSATGITGGDLTGDVTTQGSTVTTLSATGVVPGTYTNTSITVDAKGRVTFAENGAQPGSGGSSGALATKYNVANPGDAFIDVPLDTDGGYAYRILVKGQPSADSRIRFRVSEDNGQTFFDASDYYKSYTSGANSNVDLSSGRTIKSGRDTIISFTLAGMNVLTTEKFAITGTIFGIDTGINHVIRHVGGHTNSGFGNYNAFRVYVNNGNMDNFAVYVERIY